MPPAAAASPEQHSRPVFCARRCCCDRPDRCRSCPVVLRSATSQGGESADGQHLPTAEGMIPCEWRTGHAVSEDLQYDGIGVPHMRSAHDFSSLEAATSRSEAAMQRRCGVTAANLLSGTQVAAAYRSMRALCAAMAEKGLTTVRCHEGLASAADCCCCVSTASDGDSVARTSGAGGTIANGIRWVGAELWSSAARPAPKRGCSVATVGPA